MSDNIVLDVAHRRMTKIWRWIIGRCPSCGAPVTPYWRRKYRRCPHCGARVRR